MTKPKNASDKAKAKPENKPKAPTAPKAERAASAPKAARPPVKRAKPAAAAVNLAPPDPLPPAPFETPAELAPQGEREETPTSTPFFAGAAVVDITPPDPLGMFMAGFGFNRRCTGVRDPLWARAFALSDGKAPVAVVALDLIGLMRDDVQQARRLVRERLGRDDVEVLVVSTHNHASPDTIGYWGPAVGQTLPYRSGRNEAYITWLLDRVAEAAAAAVRALRPAVGAWFVAETPTTGFRKNARRGGSIDPLLRGLSLLDAASGAPIATVVNWACHPEILWSINTRLSADFAGRLCAEVERAVGGAAVFLNADLGGMVTGDIDDDAPAEERGPFVDWLGRAVAGLVVGARPAPERHRPLGVGLATSEFTLETPNRRFHLMLRLGLARRSEVRGKNLTTEASLLRVGPGALLFMPGEVLPELGARLRREVNAEPLGIVGLSGDELGYLLPQEFFHNPEYHYECSMSPGPRAETFLRDQARLLHGVLPEIEPGQERP